MTIASWAGVPYSATVSPLGLLHDAHFKTFNAAEAQTAKRARSQYLNGLRILESAFNYLTTGPEDHHEEPAEQDGYEKWLEETAKKREDEKLRELLNPKPKYSIASELDADGWDSEQR